LSVQYAFFPVRTADEQQLCTGRIFYDWSVSSIFFWFKNDIYWL